MGIVTFIPKNKEAFKTSDYRPISVGPIMARLFHRILGGRMLGCWPLSSRQKAFRPGDGIAQNLFLNKSIIRKMRTASKIELDVYWSHESFRLRVSQICPQSCGQTWHSTALLRLPSRVLQRKGGLSENQGGSQWKSSSEKKSPSRRSDVPRLFNAVIDMITSELDQSMG